MTMSFMSERSPEDGVEEKRAKKLAAARKKLKSYRASRSSITSSQSSRSGGGSPIKLSISKTVSRKSSPKVSAALPKSRQGSFSSPSHSRNPSTSAPLGDSNAGNVTSPRRPSASAKGKERAIEVTSKPEEGVAHRRTGSRASHGRHGSLAARASVMGVFDLPPLPSGHGLGFGGEASTLLATGLGIPHEIITTPATPLADGIDRDPLSIASLSSGEEAESEEDMEATRSRLSSFSFGAKPPLDATAPAAPHRRMARTPSPNGHGQPLPPSMALRMHDMGINPPSPLSSPPTSHSAPSNLHRLSATPSRPPSLLLTKPSPLPSSPSARSADPPQTPPAVSRIKRHSHSRSSSISLPNLKLAGARPNSLGLPKSPSFPTSPSSASASPVTSPGSDRGRAPRTTPAHTGTKLKFEPSGRGAEADQAKEEYRRQALAKLTAGSAPAVTQTPISPEQEIELPDLDDVDEAGESSPTGSTLISWGGLAGVRPEMMSTSPTPFWATESVGSEARKERWSGGSGFGFGMKDEGLGFGLDLGAVRRGSLTSGLSVLAEVEEVEELDEENPAADPSMAQDETETPIDTPRATEVTPADQHAIADEIPPTSSTAPTPTPRGLRGFRLSSSASHTPHRPDDAPTAATPLSTSPTKGYGAIGRGRPRPLPNLAHTAQVPISPSTTTTLTSADLITPTSARKRGRGSSISYRKDQESTSTTAATGTSWSSRDWSLDRKIGSPVTSTSSLEVTSPTSWSLGEFGSPKSSVGAFRGNANRSCPRPKSMATQALDAGANRVLGNVVEEEGDWPTVSSKASRTAGGLGLDQEYDATQLAVSHGATESVNFRDHTLELEMERDALREDVEGWRTRCRGLEEALESEKKESGALRERIRKLGDRLLTMSAVHPPHAASLDERAMAQMRDQFFQLTAERERERREKEDALRRIEAMEAYMRSSGMPISHFSPPSPPVASGIAAASWSFPKAASAGQPAPASRALPKSGDPFLSSNPPIVSPREGQDPNLHRMKAWGFPSPSQTPIPSPGITSNKRDSFFGLSAALRKRDSAVLARAEDDLGIDLPPVSIPPSPPYNAAIRAVSEPYRHTATPSAGDPHRSVSQPLSAGSSASTGAFSFISGYWRSKSSGPASATSNGSPTSASRSNSQGSRASRESEAYWKQSPPRTQPEDEAPFCVGTTGDTDLRTACKCCQGPLIEL